MKNLILLVILLLTGCAPTKWCASSNPQNFYRDRQECINEAAAFSNNFGAQGNPFLIAHQARECLRSRGYYECPDN